MLFERVKNEVKEAVVRRFGREPSVLPVELAPDPAFGDLTVSAFLLARDLKLSPPVIAAALAEELPGRGPIETAEAVKGYVNLRLAAADLFRSTLAIVRDPESFGRGGSLAGRRIMVEYSAPNTNKPLHLGHMRNNFLGDSIARVLSNAGASVVRANLLNDRGIHICKSMLAYQRFGKGETPESSGIKGDHLVGAYYVEFENRFLADRERFLAEHPDDFAAYAREKSLDESGRVRPIDEVRKEYEASFKEEGFGRIPLGRDCQEMLRLWEAGDEEVRSLWNRMNGWAMRGFEASYGRMGVTFDEVYRESETYELGRRIVLDGLAAGTFTKRVDGAIVVDLESEKLGRKVLLRSDGTSIYITQDLGTTVMKAERHRLDGQVWVVADEQAHHFKVLFAILHRLGHPWASQLHHLAYGLVHLPDGRMKSREGRVVDADDLIDEVVTLAAREIRARDPEQRLAEDEVSRRSEVIALAALRFMLLRVSPRNVMIFDPEESVRFEGDTGSRVLYAVARLVSMIHDAGTTDSPVAGDESGLGLDPERQVALRLQSFPDLAERAARDYNPSLLANYLLDVVKDLNRFYEQIPVLKEPDAQRRRGRLWLCQAAAAVVGRACELLGIRVLDRM